MFKAKLRLEDVVTNLNDETDVYSSYEVLHMPIVSTKEKEEIIRIDNAQAAKRISSKIVGWAKRINPMEDDLFIQVFEKDVLEYVNKGENKAMKILLDNGIQVDIPEELLPTIQEVLSQQKRNHGLNAEGGCWFINPFGRINYAAHGIKTLNSFTEEDYARKVALDLKVKLLLLAFKDEYDKVELDWEDDGQAKYFIGRYQGKFFVDACWTTKRQGAVYFSSDKIAQQCIDTYEDILIEYFNTDI